MLTGFFPPSVFPQLFQKGLSLPEFKRLYGTEKQCEVALEKVCGPDGFRCPRCFLMSRARAGVRPAAYVLPMPILWTPGHAHVRHDHAGLQVKLTTWFSAFYLICQAKTGISSLELSRHLGVNYDTAWLLHNKILRAITEREEAYLLRGKIQMDDSYLGGELPGGKPGRGSENKIPIVAAVSLNEAGHSR